MSRQVGQHGNDIDSLYELVAGVDRKVDAVDQKVDAVRAEMAAAFSRIEGLLAQLVERGE